MFTGLIETTGVVKRTGAVLEIESLAPLSLSRGHSLAVDGACLTVTEASGGMIRFDVSPETFKRISAPVKGRRVNLERAMEAGGRLHGHFVTGHVDCTGRVVMVRKMSGFTGITVSYPRENSRLLVEKGSVALSGISLTVAGLTEGSFTVALIPETLSGTTAGSWKPGTEVNIEFDMIGKYVVRAAAADRAEGSLREYLEKNQSGTR